MAIFVGSLQIRIDMPQFTHLHVHTQYSILDGAASIPSLMKRAKEFGMTAVAITDHGNMFGVKEFYDAANAAGLKPILGCEVYVVKNHREKDKDEKAGDHLILLAKNLKGYHNLVKLVSYSWTEGFYYKPRIDKELLRQYHEGLICSSACLGGELPQAIMHDDLEEASRIVEEFKEIFGEDYYLELQLHRSLSGAPDTDTCRHQVEVNKVLHDLAARHGVKLIVTNDVHFTLEEDAPAHDHLICLNTGRDLDDPNRMRYTGQEFFKSPDEMAALFPDDLEALENTMEIADKVEHYTLEHKPLMPDFPLPDDFVIDQAELRRIFLRRFDGQISGLEKKMADADEAKKPSLLHEMEGLRAEKAQAETADDLDAFAAGNERLGEWLTVSKQYLYLVALTMKGAKERYGEPDEKTLERIRYELGTIEWMGFPGYFLIVSDFIRAAREMGVSVGPGRGSAAGSVVAYCLKITNIDPLKYDLLFERFLNPDRISLPDVDVDFDEDGRADVLRYVIEKYGKKRVAQIVTFGTMAPKLAIRDVARVEKLPLADSDRLAKLVPDKLMVEKGETPFERAYKDSPELARERESPNPLIQNTLKYAEKLEGSVRQTGVHACGVIIGKDDLEEFAPVATAKDADLNVVQYEGKLVESVGLIKMDFLGLKTLSIIKDAVENVRRVQGINLDIDNIPLDDRKTYQLFCKGETTGIFQFESAGMKKYLRALKPNRLEDLIAMNALYRPGPMDNIPSFIARKHGQEKVEYEFPEMAEYLEDTYGITVYQEQVMLLSRLLADFTRGESDALRKAMGKKLRDKLDHMKPKFIEGGKKNGHDPKILEKIWGDWEKFASYAFNKSHATCYSWVAYQTAYLKAHYPPQYMAANLSRNISRIDEITKLMDECKVMGVQVLGPDVNESIMKFSVNRRGDIRFGLGAVKGVGENAVQAIIDERTKNGPFTSIFDFVQRVNLLACNRKNVENLALAGGFDSLPGVKREMFFAANAKGETFTELLIRYGAKYQVDKAAAINSLFGGENQVEIAKPEIPPFEPWNSLDRLNRERELVGIYLSAHPLDDYAIILENVCNTHMSDLADKSALVNRELTMGGIVTNVREGRTRNDKPFGIVKLEDYSGSGEIPFFGNDWLTWCNYLREGYFLYIRAKCLPRQWNPNELDLKIGSIELLPDVKENLIDKITITTPLSSLDKELITDISTLVQKNPGNAELHFRVVDRDSKMHVTMKANKVKISVKRDLITYIKSRPELEFKIN